MIIFCGYKHNYYNEILTFKDIFILMENNQMQLIKVLATGVDRIQETNIIIGHLIF